MTHYDDSGESFTFHQFFNLSCRNIGVTPAVDKVEQVGAQVAFRVPQAG
jgi:hypothetical protein